MCIYLCVYIYIYIFIYIFSDLDFGFIHIVNLFSRKQLRLAQGAGRGDSSESYRSATEGDVRSGGESTSTRAEQRKQGGGAGADLRPQKTRGLREERLHQDKRGGGGI